VEYDTKKKQAVFVDLLNEMYLVKEVNFRNIKYIFLIFYYYIYLILLYVL